MSEVLFILTVIFVAYVVYKTVNEQKETPKSTLPKAKPEAPKVVPEQPLPETVVKNVKPAMIKPATIKQTTSKPSIQDTVKKGLRDPKTGEVATTYSNYRFTKRWIKDALVAEGLLEKVYKNNELDAAIEATIKDAVVKLEANDKYKA
jgi:predicted transcriptional regulator